MAITRYSHRNPWHELDQLGNRLSQMFEGAGAGFPSPTASGMWAPAVSVEETQDELVLTAELPGMKPSDVDIELENNILTIRGEKHEERKEEDDNRRYHIWERSYGGFQRSFTLPRTVRAEDISAAFEDGLLRVRMPKAPEARSRRIEIRGTGAQAAGSGEVAVGQSPQGKNEK